MVNFHIDKMINLVIYQKNNSFLKFEIIEIFMIYYDIVTGVVKIFRA
jgi:hypothetical protein